MRSRIALIASLLLAGCSAAQSQQSVMPSVTALSPSRPIQSRVVARPMNGNPAPPLIVSNGSYGIAQFYNVYTNCEPWLPATFQLAAGTYKDMTAQPGDWSCGYKLAGTNLTGLQADTCYLIWSGLGGFFLIQQGDNTACNYSSNTSGAFIFIYNINTPAGRRRADSGTAGIAFDARNDRSNSWGR